MSAADPYPARMYGERASVIGSRAVDVDGLGSASQASVSAASYVGSLRVGTAAATPCEADHLPGTSQRILPKELRFGDPLATWRTGDVALTKD